MQSQLHAIRVVRPRHRQLGGFHRCPNPARLAQSRQITRQSIRQVHHRGRQSLLAQPQPQLHPRLRIQVLPQPRIAQIYPFSPAQQPQPQFRLSQPPAHINNVAHPRPRTPQSPPSRNLSNQRHINQYLSPRCGRISPSQQTIESRSRPSQPAQKLIQPSARQLLRQSQTQQKASRRSAHRPRRWPRAPGISSRPNRRDACPAENACPPETSHTSKPPRGREQAAATPHHRPFPAQQTDFRSSYGGVQSLSPRACAQTFL